MERKEDEYAIVETTSFHGEGSGLLTPASETSGLVSAKWGATWIGEMTSQHNWMISSTMKNRGDADRWPKIVHESFRRAIAMYQDDLATDLWLNGPF